MFDTSPDPLSVIVGATLLSQGKWADKSVNTGLTWQPLEERYLFTSSHFGPGCVFGLSTDWICSLFLSLCFGLSARGVTAFTVSALFTPNVPPHSGCFIQKAASPTGLLLTFIQLHWALPLLSCKQYNYQGCNDSLVPFWCFFYVKISISSNTYDVLNKSAIFFSSMQK